MKTNQQQSQRSRCQGWTLIEMSVVIGLLSVFSYVGISFIDRLMEFDNQIATTAAFQIEVDRLEDQLRLDAYQARTVAATEDGFRMTLDAKRSIEYVISSDSIQRTTTGERKAGKEIFRLIDCDLQTKLLEDRIILSIQTILPLDQLEKASLAGREPTTFQLVIGINQQQETPDREGDI